MQKQPPEVFYEKAVVKNLAILTEKHLCESLFNSEYCKIFKSAYFAENLLTAPFENTFMKLRKIENCS